jgi:alginate O-acetyltransferase complex protein AlgI
VFFRAADLPSALAYLGDLFGARNVPAAAGLLAGVIYRPWYLGILLVAAWVVFRCRDTWDYTRTLSASRAVWVVLLFSLSVVVLTTQEYNPFIYFIF